MRRQLTGPDARARQREVRDVEGADKQHERHAAPQQIQDSADASGERVLERRDGRVHVQLGQAELRKALEHRGIERVDLRPHLLDRGAGPQPADVVEPVAGARRVGLLRFRERQRNPELNLVACRLRVTVAAAVEEREPAWHDADNRVALPCPTQPQIPADHGLIAAVEALPQSVAENDFLVLADLALVVGKSPSQRRVDPQKPEQRWRRSHAAELFSGAVDGKRVEPELKRRLILECVDRGQAIEIRRRRVGEDVVRGNRRIDVAQRDDAIGIGNRQRPQQDRVDDREDGGVRAKTDRERQRGRRGKAAGFEQESDARPQVPDEAAADNRGEAREQCSLSLPGERTVFRLGDPEEHRFGFEKLVAERLPVRDMTLDFTPGLLVGQTLGDQGVIRLLDLRRQLLDDLELARSRQRERSQMLPDEAFEITHSQVPRRPGQPA